MIQKKQLTPTPDEHDCHILSEGAGAREAVHRDLKRADVLFTSEGVGKIGDFGSARTIDARASRTMATVDSRWHEAYRER
jgi:serine/threonine protein kinase